MKKTFSKPALKRYDLNSKENIVSSITYDDAHMTSSWDFIQFDATTGATVDDPGCFGMLNAAFTTTPEALGSPSGWVDFYSPLLNYNRYVTHPDDPAYASYNTDYWKQQWDKYRGCSGGSSTPY